jgi:hypothetical protein
MGPPARPPTLELEPNVFYSSGILPWLSHHPAVVCPDIFFLTGWYIRSLPPDEQLGILDIPLQVQHLLSPEDITDVWSDIQAIPVNCLISVYDAICACTPHITDPDSKQGLSSPYPDSAPLPSRFPDLTKECDHLSLPHPDTPLTPAAKEGGHSTTSGLGPLEVTQDPLTQQLTPPDLLDPI